MSRSPSVPRYNSYLRDSKKASTILKNSLLSSSNKERNRENWGKYELLNRDINMAINNMNNDLNKR